MTQIKAVACEGGKRMLYRRPPINNKRNYYTNRQPPAASMEESEIIREVEKIPLPNEDEKNERTIAQPAESRGFQGLRLFGRNISLDEIILAGLIFLLIYEKIDDEMLLILLIYILLF